MYTAINEVEKTQKISLVAYHSPVFNREIMKTSGFVLFDPVEKSLLNHYRWKQCGS